MRFTHPRLVVTPGQPHTRPDGQATAVRYSQWGCRARDKQHGRPVDPRGCVPDSLHNIGQSYVDVSSICFTPRLRAQVYLSFHARCTNPQVPFFLILRSTFFPEPGWAKSFVIFDHFYSAGSSLIVSSLNTTFLHSPIRKFTLT